MAAPSSLAAVASTLARMRVHSESSLASGDPSTTAPVDASHSQRRRSQVRARGRASTPQAAAAATVASDSERRNVAAFSAATAIVSSCVRRAQRSKPPAAALHAVAIERAISAALPRALEVVISAGAALRVFFFSFVRTHRPRATRSFRRTRWETVLALDIWSPPSNVCSARHASVAVGLCRSCAIHAVALVP